MTMPTSTDPAREFAQFCKNLRNSTTSKSGSLVLAQAFDVAPWGTDFMMIMASIHQRMEDLIDVLKQTDLDDAYKNIAVSKITTIRNAFAQEGLNSAWQSSSNNFLNDDNLLPIEMLSLSLRATHGYTVPQGDEITLMLDDVRQLLEWLKEQEITERDFVRSALIEGLKIFIFRAERVNWFGWPETYKSLREVVGAYMALTYNRPMPENNPVYEAIVIKTASVVKKVFERVKFAKKFTETGDWVLRTYGALHLIGNHSAPVAGLLTHIS